MFLVGLYVRCDRNWAICREIATNAPPSSQISPSSSNRPQVMKRVRKMHFNHSVVGSFRMLTEHSSVGTQATIPWVVSIAGGLFKPLSQGFFLFQGQFLKFYRVSAFKIA
jgi:hypothetical protein